MTVGQGFLVGGGAIILTALAYNMVSHDFVPEEIVIANYKFQAYCPLNKISNQTSL